MLSPTTAREGVHKDQLRWYLAGVGSWFAAFGLQQVLVTYLITTVLNTPADLLGLAQGVMNLPAVFLLLVGGAVADHFDNRRLMIVFHILAAVPAVFLAVMVWMDLLVYEWIIVYGLAIGTVTAFIMPAREAMMARVIGAVGGHAVQKAVTTTVGIQFISQMIGMATARLAAFVGVAPLLLLQSAVQLFGAFAASRLQPAPPSGAAHGLSMRAHAWRIVEGIKEVRNSPALLPITIIAFAIGVLFIGSFMVILPVILREEFNGNVEQFSTMQLSFWGGSIISSLGISRVGNITRRGRLVACALSLGFSVQILLGFSSPLWVLYGLVFVWGLGAGIVISMSRTIVQEHAPPAHRARILSVYQLGFTGGMPIGAILLGFIVHDVGPRAATIFPALAMAAVVTILLATTQLWRITSTPHN